MSSPKPIQVPPPPHVKFTKAGRAYADIDRLIDTELGRPSAPTTPPPPPATEQPARPEGQNQNQNR
jgi:hypothetical protein